MIILAIRTDNPRAEIGLYEDGKKLGYFTWTAHRELAETIHVRISELLQKSNKQLGDVGGIVVFKGSGSFTGLRIGISVANTLAYSLQVKVVGSKGEDWITRGISLLSNNTVQTYVLPEYGAPIYTTKPKK